MGLTRAKQMKLLHPLQVNSNNFNTIPERVCVFLRLRRAPPASLEEDMKRITRVQPVRQIRRTHDENQRSYIPRGVYFGWSSPRALMIAYVDII